PSAPAPAPLRLTTPSQSGADLTPHTLQNSADPVPPALGGKPHTAGPVLGDTARQPLRPRSSGPVRSRAAATWCTTAAHAPPGRSGGASATRCSPPPERRRRRA